MNYTFIINYNGGTYISQVIDGKNLTEAIYKWLDRFKLENIDDLKSNILEQVQGRIVSEDYDPILLDGMNNVWCNDLGIIESQYFSMTIVN